MMMHDGKEDGFNVFVAQVFRASQAKSTEGHFDEVLSSLSWWLESLDLGNRLW